MVFNPVEYVPGYHVTLWIRHQEIAHSGLYEQALVLCYGLLIKLDSIFSRNGVVAIAIFEFR